MFSTFITKVEAFFNALPFSTATWFLLGIILFFVWMFKKAQKDPNSPVDWVDLILDHEDNRVSPYKVGYLIGLIVGTWVVIKYADADKLTWDILGGYLAYLLGGAGWVTMSKERTNAAYYQGVGMYGGGMYGRPPRPPMMGPQAPIAPQPPQAPQAPIPPKVDDVIG